METFSEPREFVENPRYARDRQATLAALDTGAIDEPIVDVVTGFAALPHGFPLQSCCGHFVCAPGQDPRTLEPVPPGQVGMVRYRIAYVAFCLENSPRGRRLRKSLARVAEVDPGYVQFGSPDWYWTRVGMLNTYALQVEPSAHQREDVALLDPTEALRTQRARDLFFAELRSVLAAERAGREPES